MFLDQVADNFACLLAPFEWNHLVKIAVALHDWDVQLLIPCFAVVHVSGDVGGQGDASGKWNLGTEGCHHSNCATLYQLLKLYWNGVH